MLAMADLGQLCAVCGRTQLSAMSMLERGPRLRPMPELTSELLFRCQDLRAFCKYVLEECHLAPLKVNLHHIAFLSITGSHLYGNLDHNL